MATQLQSSGALTVGVQSLYNGDCTIVATPEAPVSIGSYCAFGRNLTIMPLNHDTNFAAVQGTLYRRIFDEPHPGEVGSPSRERTKGGVSIGSDVWIADNVTILSGVSIGDGCCIGAGSVVTRSIPPYTVSAGAPCRPIRSRFPDDIVRLLCDLKWWTWPDDRIHRNRAFFRMNLAQARAEDILATIVA